MSANRVLWVVLSAWTVACGGGLSSVPAVPGIPTAPTLSAPTAAPAPAAPPPSAETATPPAAKEAPAPTASSEEADAASERERAKATPPAPPPEPVEAKGKLLTKPAKGTFQIEVTSNAPAVGDEAELSRIIDKSVPLFGGGWIVIAKTEVVKVDGKKVTLKILEERAQMKVNGKKLDHFTPGVAVRMKVAKKA